MRGKIVLKELDRLRGLGVITDEIYQSIGRVLCKPGGITKSLFLIFL